MYNSWPFINSYSRLHRDNILELKYQAFACFFSLAKTHSIKVIVLKGLEKKLGMILNSAALLTRHKHKAKRQDNTDQQIAASGSSEVSAVFLPDL